MKLEDKLKRLHEIQTLIESGSVSLDESLSLLEEAFGLKREIEEELKKIENKLIQLNSNSEDYATQSV